MKSEVLLPPRKDNSIVNGGGLRRATRPVRAIMEFVKNVLRAISPFKGSRDDDDAPATAGALNGLAAAAKKPAAAAPAPTRSSARQAAKAKAPAKSRAASRIFVYPVFPTSSSSGVRGYRLRRTAAAAGDGVAVEPALDGLRRPRLAARRVRRRRRAPPRARPLLPRFFRAARHRVRSERLGGPPTDATTTPNERSPQEADGVQGFAQEGAGEARPPRPNARVVRDARRVSQGRREAGREACREGG